MEITAARPEQIILAAAYCFSLLIGWSRCQEGACLQDGKHKATPSPEPFLNQCALYAENACCSQNDIPELAASPGLKVEEIFWDTCGPLSPGCTDFLRRIACFHLCSPDAARWPHPQHPASYQAVPLCHSFCRDWFETCKTDLTCTRNSVGDGEWHRHPINCTGNCVTYQQMYENGRNLCESVWGDAFMSVEDDGDGTEAGSCGCLTLSPSDREVIAALRAQEEDPDELDTTKTGLPQYRAPCRPQHLDQGTTSAQQAQKNNENVVMRKRSIFVEDVEGSGSGF
ncbi:riboflavin-binding protein-like [Scleropages formosus]|nr:riboflavin-binding protein-like [Scleropages formosus]